jgi:hypothetical protein
VHEGEFARPAPRPEEARPRVSKVEAIRARNMGIDIDAEPPISRMSGAEEERPRKKTKKKGLFHLP